MHKRFFVFWAFFFLLGIAASDCHAYTITATAGVGGSISPSGAVTVSTGADQIFTITPDPDYGVFDVLVDSISIGATLSHTFNNVMNDHLIEASFTACDYLFPVMLDGDGSLFGTIMEAYDYASFDLGLNDFTLKLMADTLIYENLFFDQDVSVVLDGGYDCSFLDNSLVSEIAGSITIAAGTVVPSNIVITGVPPCAPGDPNNFPGNTEICDGGDNDCDGQVDEGFDLDGDTVTTCGGDCDDNDPNNFPGNPEICDGQDNNCDGQVDEGLSAVDIDGDGFTATTSCGGTADDCNDNNVNIYPGATEIPLDGIDQDCDGQDLVYTFTGSQVDCTVCHGPASTWYNSHATGDGSVYDVAAPDGTCISCHGAPVDNMLSGHYGNTVRTAGNNMGAGQIIYCQSCHDDHGEEEPFTPLGDGIVWPKLYAAGPFNVTCDTCHENRAAVHQTDTAHDNRLIDPTCGACHVVSTNAEVDTLHQSDCNLCHNYFGTKFDAAAVKQAIQDGINGIPVTCGDCHGEFEAIHGTLDHTALINVGTTSCGDCHSNPPPLVDDTDPKVHDSCYSCHDTSGGLVSLAAGKSFAVGGDCTTCHTDPFDTIHPDTIDHTAIVTVGATSCGNCHSDPPPLVDVFDPKVHNGCASCHDSQGGLISLAAGKSFAVGGTCATCHTDPFATIHPDDIDHTAIVTVGATSCGNCHSDPPPLIDAVDPKIHNDCSSCHDETGALVSLAAGQSFATGGDCATCHTDPFATIHPDDVDHSLAIQLSFDCAGCHNAPPPVIDAADPRVHNDCTSCHDDNGALISLASGNTSPNECTTCHGNDLGSLHPSSSASHNATPGSQDVLIFAEGQHDAAMIGDGTVYIACMTCHNTQLGFVHDNNCATCHPSPADTVIGSWTGGCQQGGCHTTYHDDVTASHGTVENQCEQCHQITDWSVPDTACANCHATFDPADTTPPVTTSDAQASYIIPALINFSVTDNGGLVGVGTTYYIIDGGATQVGSSALVTSNGNHTLEFWSVDQAGNVESPANIVNFTISPDTTPPVTTSNAVSSYYQPATITLTATDDNMVDITTYYSIDGGPTQTGNTVNVAELDGTFSYTLQFWSEDWTGNVESPNTVNFTIYGGRGTLRLVWGDSDTTGSPCPGYPQAEAHWTIRRGTSNGPVVATGSGVCPGWSGVDDITLDVSANPSYYVSIDWWDESGGFFDNTVFMNVMVGVTHGDFVQLSYP